MSFRFVQRSVTLDDLELL